MKKNKQSFILCLTIIFIALQMVSQLTLKNDSYNNNDFRNTLSNQTLSNSLKVFINTDSSYYSHHEYTDSDYRTRSHAISNFHFISHVSDNAKSLTEHLPDYFQYKIVKEAALKDYLKTRNSLLMDEPYFSSIITVAKDFNINPILLFAITGQEQGFVPTTEYSCMQIANNPYNVFCSWQDYNTDIIDTSQIACRTIIHLAKDKPDNIDTLVWINRKYSADQNWSEGVKTLYNDINTFIDNYNK